MRQLCSLSLFCSLLSLSLLAESNFKERLLREQHSIFCQDAQLASCEAPPTGQTLYKIKEDLGEDRQVALLAAHLVPGSALMGLIAEVCTSEDVLKFQEIAQHLDQIKDLKKKGPFELFTRSCIEALGIEYHSDL